MGPNPTNRGTPGTKRHIVTYRRDIPLVARLTKTNHNDSVVLADMVDVIRPIRRPCGRSRERLVNLHADTDGRHPALPAGAVPPP